LPEEVSAKTERIHAMVMSRVLNDTMIIDKSMWLPASDAAQSR